MALLTAWGSNRFGQIGRDEEPKAAPHRVAPARGVEAKSFKARLEPAPWLEDERFVAAAAGEGHTLIVSENGNLFAVC